MPHYSDRYTVTEAYSADGEPTGQWLVFWRTWCVDRFATHADAVRFAIRQSADPTFSGDYHTASDAMLPEDAQ